jgi:hypothetical protein
MKKRHPASSIDTLPWTDEGIQDTPYVDWEALKEDLERARKDILQEIEWEEIKREIRKAARSMDSLFREMYLSPALPDSVR